ncbi:hypothetical protein [Streptomyces sp. NPDC017529]|uniref:hypothetical protein n=1 Tax=Streptomyces sp. NPDC017529 TaxID=3365000 RepID=UPI0037AA1616
MTWVVLAFNALMLAWLITGISQASSAEDCGEHTGDALRLCQAANDAGTAIGAGLIIALWAVGAVILGVLWLVTGPTAQRMQRRQ